MSHTGKKTHQVDVLILHLQRTHSPQHKVVFHNFHLQKFNTNNGFLAVMFFENHLVFLGFFSSPSARISWRTFVGEAPRAVSLMRLIASSLAMFTLTSLVPYLSKGWRADFTWSTFILNLRLLENCTTHLSYPSRNVISSTVNCIVRESHQQ